MTVTIIGWYGTETLGDRAILAGIFHVIFSMDSSCRVRLGSLHPVLTERTLLEDKDFYNGCAGVDFEIAIFDSLSEKQLRLNISDSDLVVVGGGPLMDLQEMNMLGYAFRYASVRHKRCLLLGCGWGPLTQSESMHTGKELVRISAMSIFRDDISGKLAENASPDAADRIISIIDPAFLSCCVYRKKRTAASPEEFIAVNFRDLTAEGDHYSRSRMDDSMFVGIIRQVLSSTQLPVLLVPMHTFAIGGDDRIILERIAQKVKDDRIAVQHSPLSLEQTMDCFSSAKACIGMRFHSVLMQTALNGNNYIVDYTHPREGKIGGLIRQLGMTDFYAGRYYSLQTGGDYSHWDFCSDSTFECVSKYEMFMGRYIKALTPLFK